MTRSIYIVLTATKTWLSRTIQFVTKDRYNHVSIALDPFLCEMYSFGRRKYNNPFIGGFTQEQCHNPIFEQAHCAIYTCQLTVKQYETLRNRLRMMREHSEEYQYHFLGLLAVWCGYKWERHNAYFCSQFVATLLKELDFALPHEEPFFVKPNDFAYLPYATPIYEGALRHYLPPAYNRARLSIV